MEITASNIVFEKGNQKKKQWKCENFQITKDKQTSYIQKLVCLTYLASNFCNCEKTLQFY